MSESRAAASRPLLLQQAAQAAVEHLEGVEQRAVAPTAAALDALALLPAEVPRTGRDGREVIAQLASVGGPAMHGSVRTIGRPPFPPLSLYCRCLAAASVRDCPVGVKRARDSCHSAECHVSQPNSVDRL